MNDFPFSNYDLESADVDAINAVFDSLKEKFEVAYDPDLTYNFQALQLFANRKINNGPAIKITTSRQSFHLAFIHVGYSYSYARKYHYGLMYEYQAWGITTLPEDYGHIFIKHESMIDKIQNLIHPIEIKFDDDAVFSKDFYVITNDEAKARQKLNQSFRNQIKNLNVKDFVIEILDNNLVIGNQKIIQPDSAIAFVNFMDNLASFH